MLISLQEAAGFVSTHYAVFDELWRRKDDRLADVPKEALEVLTRQLGERPRIAHRPVVCGGTATAGRIDIVGFG